jgi:RNA polymerase sigma-70 factor (ECF subfamily)
VAGVTGSDPMADERLRIEAAQRDPARFAELYEEHFDRVYAYVARRVRHRHQAEDVTSEVFQQALANLGRFEWRGVPFAAWLMRIAANELADRYQRSARSPSAPPADPPAPAALEDRASVVALVQALPADQRMVVQMRFAEGMKVGEIARELGRSEGAIKQLQLRALRTLRARMGGRHE